MGIEKCYHCGDKCGNGPVVLQDKIFCCNGCKTVYEIFTDNGLSYYYDLQPGAGRAPSNAPENFDFLDHPSILESLLDFDGDNLQIINLYIPQIHCSSCIWVLENLNKLNPHVMGALVDFPKKTVRIKYKSDALSLKELVRLLSNIGYTPTISLNDFENRKTHVDRSLIYKLGVAGFAFGNVMFLSFPDYFDFVKDGGEGDFWLLEYQPFFRWLMFLFSLPVVFYAAQDYFLSAYNGIRKRLLNMDIPIALGIAVLFIRSTADILLDHGPGYFDSLTGLVFFLLLGKFFQQRTYSFLSFERDYKSYFPIAVTQIKHDGSEESVPSVTIKKGDRLLIRNGEIIPVDGILTKGNGQIDYSFVSGEEEPVAKQCGDKIYAGGRQTNGILEMEALKSISQSYLTGLWGNAIFKEEKNTKFQSLTDQISKRFTVAVLSIALLATSFWLYYDASNALNVLTSVLIIACPCAIALASPFTLGNMLRFFGKQGFYLKDAQAIERLAATNFVVFDKTGTLTTTAKSTASYEGIPLTVEEETLLKNTLRASNHPLSRKLYSLLSDYEIGTLEEFEEEIGKGIYGLKDEKNIRAGSSDFVGNNGPYNKQETAVHISSNEDYKGRYVFNTRYRKGLGQLFGKISKSMGLAILSGDNSGERATLQKMLPKKTPMFFNQKPKDKLNKIKAFQKKGKNVLMVGDGLNDAGALAQSDVGIAISEDINVFSPASDAILDASKLNRLYAYVMASKQAVKIIKASFLLSLAYNVIGVYFAITGQLVPVIAAILMPLSSISVVVFTSLATSMINHKMIK